MISNRTQELETLGFTVEPRALDEPALERLLSFANPFDDANSVLHRSGEPFAIRGLLWSAPLLRNTLADLGLDALATSILGRPAFPIDVIFFDKQSQANWTVPAHQDRVLPVSDTSQRLVRHRTGISYAEPNAAALANLVALRVNFDAADATTGGLCFAPGSHRAGILSDHQTREVPLDSFQACRVSRGDVLMMRPLVLHRSSPSKGNGHRRVMHVVYATESPGDGLQWRT